MEILLRPSVPEDVPVQRTLWSLSFGDERAYINNFYKNYYRPDRVLVLEVEGAVRAMTAWFSTVLSIPGKDQIFRAAYLYAVCVHPDWRGKGLASKLLEGAGLYFRDRGIQAVTTVPASQELHGFFAKQGFFECFTQDERQWTPELAKKAPETLPKIKLVNAAEYGVLREGLLSKLGHIGLPMDALLYQAGCCRIDGGGMYLVGAPRRSRRPVRRGHRGQDPAGQGAHRQPRSGGPDRRRAAPAAAQVRRDLSHPGRQRALRHDEVALPGAGSGLGPGHPGLSGLGV